MVNINSASLSFQMTSKTVGGGITAGLDIRKQAIMVSPEKTSISIDKENDKTEVTVTLAAVVDVGKTVKVRMKDVTEEEEDPYPSHELQFKPDALTFTRESSASYQTKAQRVEITLKKKEKEEPLSEPGESKLESAEVQGELLGKRAAAYDDFDEEEIKKFLFYVGLAATHTTIITMIAGGKGDCYILSDQLGTGQWFHGLIDGGAGGTIARLSLALNTRNVMQLSLLCATHYDDDHINGMKLFVVSSSCTF